MKKGLAIVLTLMLVLSVAGMAFAQPPLNFSTAITPNATTVEPGEVVDLTATTSVTHPGEGAQYFSDTWSDNVYDVVNASGSGSSYTSTAKFSSDTEGIYYVTYSITLKVGANEGTEGDEAEITVEEINGVIPIVVECPAAPAIAAHLLQENNVRGRVFGEYVSAVAHEMGSHPDDVNGSWFHGIDKCIVVDGVDTANPAYAEAVDAYLKLIGAY